MGMTMEKFRSVARTNEHCYKTAGSLIFAALEKNSAG